jgi:hypothetical protein
LDKYHIDAINKFTMSYTLYCTDPCDPNKYNSFQKSVDEILKSIDTLRKLNNEIKVQTSPEDKKLGPNDILKGTDEIDKLIAQLGNFYKV